MSGRFVRASKYRKLNNNRTRQDGLLLMRDLQDMSSDGRHGRSDLLL